MYCPSADWTQSLLWAAQPLTVQFVLFASRQSYRPTPNFLHQKRYGCILPVAGAYHVDPKWRYTSVRRWDVTISCRGWYSDVIDDVIDGHPLYQFPASDVINPTSITLCHTKHARGRGQFPMPPTNRPVGLLYCRIGSTSSTAGRGTESADFRLHFIRRHLFA